MRGELCSGAGGSFLKVRRVVVWLQRSATIPPCWPVFGCIDVFSETGRGEKCQMHILCPIEFIWLPEVCCCRFADFTVRLVSVGCAKWQMPKAKVRREKV